MTTRPAISAGMRYMALSAFGFSVMALLVKLAGQRLPSQEVVLARAVIGLVLSWSFLRHAGISVWGHNKPLLVLRGLLGFGGLCCYFYAVIHLPLAEATVIQYLSPVLTALLAAAVLREALTPAVLVATGISLVGVTLVAKPAVLFGDASDLDSLAVAVALGGATFSAMAYTVVRRLGRTEHPLVVVFYFPLVALPLTIPTVAPTAVWPVGSEWLVLLGVGIFTQIGQVYLTRGLQSETAGRATALSYLQVVFATAWGALVFGERPDAWTIVGALLILVASIAVATERRST